VVGATVDTQDPSQWAVDLATQLESGVLLTRDGTGHVSYLHSQCAYDTINAYLLNLDLPAAGTLCPSTGGPFG
jgi:hypothetical protein